jgi:titin
LTWAFPKDDGGSKITGYLVEKREMNRRSWQTLTRTIEHEIVALNLVEGVKYMFQVRAENRCGLGEAADTHAAIMAKNPWCK